MKWLFLKKGLVNLGGWSNGVLYPHCKRIMTPENFEQGQWYATELQPHEAELRAWLRNRFPSGLDFDDIVQDAFVSAWKAHEQGTLRSPKAFLFGAARNLALYSMRSRKVRGYDTMVQIEDTLGRAFQERVGAGRSVRFDDDRSLH